jgi:hypothetical protein
MDIVVISVLTGLAVLFFAYPYVILITRYLLDHEHISMNNLNGDEDI